MTRRKFLKGLACTPAVGLLPALVASWPVPSAVWVRFEPRHTLTIAQMPQHSHHIIPFGDWVPDHSHGPWHHGPPYQAPSVTISGLSETFGGPK